MKQFALLSPYCLHSISCTISPLLAVGLILECCISSALLPPHSVHFCRVHMPRLYIVSVCICCLAPSLAFLCTAAASTHAIFKYNVFVCICICCSDPSPSFLRTAAASTMYQMAHWSQSSSNQSSEVGAFLWFFSPSILQFMNLEGFVVMFCEANTSISISPWFLFSLICPNNFAESRTSFAFHTDVDAQHLNT